MGSQLTESSGSLGLNSCLPHLRLMCLIHTIKNAFIGHAVKNHNVRRFVLLAGSTSTKGVHCPGHLWQHLGDVGVEYCLLLATWFMSKVVAHACD
jgi:hypothetical protein